MKYKKKTLFNFITKEYLVIMKNKKRTYLTTHPFKSLIGISFLKVKRLFSELRLQISCLFSF